MQEQEQIEFPVMDPMNQGLFKDVLRENYKLKDQIIQLLKQIEIYRSELAMASISTEDRHKEMASIETLLNFIVEDSQQYRSTIQNLQLVIQQHEETIHVNNQQISNNQEIKNEEIKIHDQEWQYKIEEIHQQMQQQSDVLTQEMSKCKHYQTKNMQRKQRIHQMEQALKASEDIVQQQVVTHNLQLQKIQETEQRYNKLLQDTLRKHKEELKSRIDTHQQQTNQLTISHTEKCKIMQSEYDALQQTLIEEQKHGQTLQNKIDELNYQFVDYRLQSNQQKGELEVQLTNKQAQLTLMINSFDKLHKESEQLKLTIQQQCDSIKQLEDNTKAQDKQLIQSRLRIQQLETQIKDNNAQFKRRIEQYIEDTDNEQKMLLEEYQMNLENKLQSQQKEQQIQLDYMIAAKNEELSKLKLSMQLQNDDHNIQMFNNKKRDEIISKEHQAAIQELKDQLFRLENLVKEKDQSIKFHAIEAQELKRTINTSEQRHKAAQQEAVKELQTIMRNYEENNKELIKSITTPLQQTIDEKTAELVQQKEQYTNVMNEMKQHQQMHVEMEQINNKRISDLQNELMLAQQTFMQQNNKLQQKNQQIMTIIKSIQLRQHNLQQSIEMKEVTIQQQNEQTQELRTQLEEIQYKTTMELKCLQEELGDITIVSSEQLIEITQLKQQLIEADMLRIQLEQQNEQANKLTLHAQQDLQRYYESYQAGLKSKSDAIKQLQQELQQSEQGRQDLINQLKEQELIWLGRLQEVEQQHQNNRNKYEEQIRLGIMEEVNKSLIGQESLDDLKNAHKEEISRLIIQYEAMIDQCNNQIPNLVINSQDGVNIFSLRELLNKEQREHEQTKEEYSKEKFELNKYINDLNMKFQAILQGQTNDVDELAEQRNTLKLQNEQLLEQVTQLKEKLIQQDLEYKLQMEQYREVSEVQLLTITENCNMELEAYKKKSEDHLSKYESIRRQLVERQPRPEDSELINKLYRDLQELYDQVNSANDKVKEAVDIIKYLDLEIQNYKKVTDMFGAQPPRDPSLNTQKMIQRVTQIKQELENTQNKVRITETTIKQERQSSDNGSDSLQPIQLEKLPPMSKRKIPKMLTSLRSNLSDVQPIIGNQSQPNRDIHDINLNFKVDLDTPIEPPTNFNAFVDTRHHYAENKQKQNKYASYLEKKKNRDQSVNLEVKRVSDVSSYPNSNSRIIQKSKEKRQSEKFTPYYLRNPDTRPRTQKKRDYSFNLSGNSVII